MEGTQEFDGGSERGQRVIIYTYSRVQLKFTLHDVRR